jgi:predicted transcriptional regulator
MPLSSSEWIVMNAVWDRPVESSIRDVLEAVESQTGWAYQSVQSLMSRLEHKGALSSRMRANTRLYTARLGRKEAQAEALRHLREGAFGGSSAALLRMVLEPDTLTREQQRELREGLKGRLGG